MKRVIGHMACWIVLCNLAWCLTACTQANRGTMAERKRAELEGMVGKKVTLEGVPEDRVDGAVLVVEGVAICLRNAREWPFGFVAGITQRARVTGFLVQREEGAGRLELAEYTVKYVNVRPEE